MVYGLVFGVWFMFGLVFGLIWFVRWLVTCVVFHTERFTTHKFLSPLYVLLEHENSTYFIFFLNTGAIMAIRDMFSFISVLFNDILSCWDYILSLLEKVYMRK